MVLVRRWRGVALGVRAGRGLKRQWGEYYRTDDHGYRWLEKNGGWAMDGTAISTSVCLFGPGVFGALFMNSDTADSGPGADTVLHEALVAAYKSRA